MVQPLIRRAGFLNFLDKPVDFDKKFMGKPFLGSHKTWRGAISGIVLGMLVALVQVWLYKLPFAKEISFLDYSQINIWLFGFLISAGAVFGDLLFAFIKRRLNIEPGGMFMPLDQINYVIGAAIFLTFFLKIHIMVWATLFISTFILHILFNKIGYFLGLHKNKW